MATIRGALWSTPDLPPTVSTSCRRLLIPDHLVDAVGGALELLTLPEMWQEVGDETVKEVTEEMTEMWVLTRERHDCVDDIGTTRHNFRDDWPDWLIPCDGRNVLRVDYPELYAVIASQFIVDADNMEMPDLRNRYLKTANSDSMGDTGGETRVTLTKGQMPVHRHVFSNYVFGIDVEPPIGIPDPTGVGSPKLPTENTQTEGQGQSHENQPPYYTTRVGMVAK